MNSVLIWMMTHNTLSPYEDEKWHFADEARAYFVARLEQRNGVFFNLHGYLKEYFEAQRQDVQDANTPQARELDWRIAYHLAPSSPDEAVERLSTLGENALQANRVADVKGVIDLFEEQNHWLSAYQVERAYFEGRYAYAKHNYKLAEDRFQVVWEQGQPNLMKAIAGHLLGLIWARRNARQWHVKAERLYRRSLEILQNQGRKALRRSRTALPSKPEIGAKSRESSW